jgi:CheY-like chemotaxis protein
MRDIKSDDVKLLVLDDDDENRELSHKIFSLEKARVVLAATASEAERVLQASPSVDALVIDVSLQGAGVDKAGAELARRIRADQPDLPIIGYSAYFSEDDLTAEERTAFTSYFERGGSVQEVGEWVEHCLDEAVRYRRARRETLYQQLVSVAQQAADKAKSDGRRADEAGPRLGPDLDRLLDAASTAEAQEYLAESGTPLERGAAAGLKALSEPVESVSSQHVVPFRETSNLRNLAVGLVYLEHRLDELARKLDTTADHRGWRLRLDDSAKIVAVLAGLVAVAVGVIKLLGA